MSGDFTLSDGKFEPGDTVVAFLYEDGKWSFARGAEIIAKSRRPGAIRYEYFVRIPGSDKQNGVAALVYGGDPQERPEAFCAYMAEQAEALRKIPVSGDSYSDKLYRP